MSDKYTDDFNKARLGSTALAACEVCGGSTGEIIFKSKGNPKGPEFTGRAVRVEGALCEFCRFLPMWMAHVGIEPGTVRCGAAKIVDSSPERKLIAFVPFREDEARDKTLVDGTPFKFAHGMVIRAEPTPGWSIRQVEGAEPSEILFWSNASGWGSQETAEVFTDEEKATLDLPMGGEWCPNARGSMALVEILERGV